MLNNTPVNVVFFLVVVFVQSTEIVSTFVLGNSFHSGSFVSFAYLPERKTTRSLSAVSTKRNIESMSSQYALKVLNSKTVTKAGGIVYQCQHTSIVNKCNMIFSIFLPSSCCAVSIDDKDTKNQAVPIVYFLSGLTCTDQNFVVKAGIPNGFETAETENIIVIVPDTSPRSSDDLDVPNDDGYDLGQGAGFYINATESPWNVHFNMESYITKELPAVVSSSTQFKHCVDASNTVGITGHSMGGHGAITLALKYPDLYSSVSAFAPILHPTQCDWGKKAFSNYFGSVDAGKTHDATELLLKSKDPTKYTDILIDQGLDDEFYPHQLLTDDFAAAAKRVNQPVTIRKHDGMDHSYNFISKFMSEHISYHAEQLHQK